MITKEQIQESVTLLEQYGRGIVPVHCSLAELAQVVDAFGLHQLFQLVATSILEINDNLENLQAQISRVTKRRKLSAQTKRIHRLTISAFYAGDCPCCRLEPVMKDGRESGSEYDHAVSLSDNSTEATWLICRNCNLRLRDQDERTKSMTQFRAYQEFRKQCEQGPQQSLWKD